MHVHGSFAWKKIPFFRLIIPFIAGIVTQYYSGFQAFYSWLAILLCVFFLWYFSRRPAASIFRHQYLHGILLFALLFCTGSLVAFYNDVRNHQQWVGHLYRAGDTLLVKIEEPLAGKTKSYKTSVSIHAIIRDGQSIQVQGAMLLYLAKDSTSSRLHYGTLLLLSKRINPVLNTGNPGSYNYAQYAAFKNIWHQVYLLKHEYIIAEKTQTNPVKRIINDTREKLVNLLKRHIAGKKQAGLAEALLMGYRDDIDKPLLQAYTETGIVHIIAVSGQHLGLLYGILLFLSRPLQAGRTRWLKTGLLLVCLWAFAFLAGGGPSVLRSAVMFSFLLIGSHLPGNTSIYNSLTASAFLLLCLNPWWLWDAGFQLSYVAVLSLALFMKPVYQWLPINNKIPDFGWKIISVTIAAQILTLPLSVWHFHQLPHLFLLTNLVAVPVSAILLTGGLLLCAVAFIPLLAKAIGWALYWLIYGLNSFIEFISRLPFSHTDHLQLTGPQLLLLYINIAGLAAWWLYQKKSGFLVMLAASWLFLLLQAVTNWSQANRLQWVVYNVPKYRATDFVTGRSHVFSGDAQAQQDTSLYNFYIKPTRTALGMATNTPASVVGGEKAGASAYNSTVTSTVISSGTLYQHGSFYRFGGKTLLFVDSNSIKGGWRRKQYLPAVQPIRRIPVDFILLSHNPPISVKALINVFDCPSIIIDASNSRWKTSSWEQECRRLGVLCHSVATQGAFVLNLH